MYAVGQERLYLPVALAYEEFRAQDGRIYSPDDILQKLQVPLSLLHHHLPVPLVHIERVQVVQFLIGTNGIHVGIYSVSRLHMVVGKRHPLPFCERMHHLRRGVAHILYRETHGALHSVQVVVDAESLHNEQRRRNASQLQFRGKVHLEEFLYHLDSMLRLFHVEKSLICFRFYQIAHIFLDSFSKLTAKI